MRFVESIPRIFFKTESHGRASSEYSFLLVEGDVVLERMSRKSSWIGGRIKQENMGTAPPSKPQSVAPSRPFDKYGRRRSCLGAVILLPRRRNSHYSSPPTTLMQLVLLKDWQRVLIRATLFPQEIKTPCTLKLYGIHWKLLPLHLACSLQPPPKVVSVLLSAGAASTPVEERKKLRFVPSWKFTSSPTAPDDREDLLTTRNDDSLYGDDGESSIVSTTTYNSAWVQNDLVPKGSLMSMEQSIGDRMTTSCATRTVDGTALDTSLCNFLDKTGVVLQLTESGGILPMPVIQSKDTTSMTETSLEFLQEPLLQAAAETKTLLPIHIACLYQASPSVIQLLLQDYPMGALSAIVGMLPIHFVAAGWSVEPFVSASTFQSTMQIDDGTASNVVQSLRVLTQALPESLAAKSGMHGMMPMGYVEESMEGKKKEECMELLQQAHDDYRQGNARSNVEASHEDGCNPLAETSIPSEIHCLSSSSSTAPRSSLSSPQSVLYNYMLERDWQKAIEWIEADPSKAREWHYGIDNTSTNEPILWKRLALHLACTVAAPIGLIDLLLQLYPKALGCPDPHNGSIPMHLACQYGSSLQVVRALIQARTASTKAVDARGRLPLHYAILSAAPYAIIELMVQHDPASVLCPDQEGKTPLQYCQHSYPVGNPVIGLLELVWM